MRSFLPMEIKDECVLSKHLKQKFNIKNFSEMLLMIQETLVFQRPIKHRELKGHYEIEAPIVRSTDWNYNEDILKKHGKDIKSRKKKEVSSIREELVPYETLSKLIKRNNRGMNLLFKAAEDQWKLMDNKHYDPKGVYDDNFFSFLDSLVFYFKNKYRPLLDGTVIKFRDRGREELEGSVFSSKYLDGELKNLDLALDEMHFFKSSNPTLAVSRDEVRNIISGKISNMSHSERFIKNLSDCFYLIAKELQILFELHKKWSKGESVLNESKFIRIPLKTKKVESDSSNAARPIPFYDCAILAVENGNALTKDLIGKRLLDDSLDEGTFIDIMAFCYQFSYECFNERINKELETMKELIVKIDRAND